MTLPTFWWQGHFLVWQGHWKVWQRHFFLVLFRGEEMTLPHFKMTLPHEKMTLPPKMWQGHFLGWQGHIFVWQSHKRVWQGHFRSWQGPLKFTTLPHFKMNKPHLAICGKQNKRVTLLFLRKSGKVIYLVARTYSKCGMFILKCGADMKK